MEKKEHKYKSYAHYLSLIKRLVESEGLSMSMLCFTVPFFALYEKKVSHRLVACELLHASSLKWLTIEQRHERINSLLR